MGKGSFKDDPGFVDSKNKPSDIVRERNIYIICEEDEGLSDALQLVGEDRIMLGSDMPHSESHPNSFQHFEGRTDQTPSVKDKVVNDNARQFFSCSLENKPAGRSFSQGQS
jgi:predicted TIM-barrel fold metal-dependent hydrolase